MSEIQALQTLEDSIAEYTKTLESHKEEVMQDIAADKQKIEELTMKIQYLNEFIEIESKRNKELKTKLDALK